MLACVCSLTKLPFFHLKDKSIMSEEKSDLNDQLARERNRQSADRTLLAWVRTSLAMISLGFAIERLGQAAFGFENTFGNLSPTKTKVFGAALIVLGISATLVGMWEHRHMLGAILDEHYRYRDRTPIARYMGAALVLVGIVALAVIFGF